jgi:hypothetical protein
LGRRELPFAVGNPFLYTVGTGVSAMVAFAQVFVWIGQRGFAVCASMSAVEGWCLLVGIGVCWMVCRQVTVSVCGAGWSVLESMINVSKISGTDASPFEASSPRRRHPRAVALDGIGCDVAVTRFLKQTAR